MTDPLSTVVATRSAIDQADAAVLNAQSEAENSRHQCSVCKKRYTRLDHLSRHFRSHTREKPFTCPLCGKVFGRVDLLKRHVDNHPGSRQLDQGSGASSRTRTSRACATCASSKTRCDGSMPCERCKLKGVECKYRSQLGPSTRQGRSTLSNGNHRASSTVPAGSASATDTTGDGELLDSSLLTGPDIDMIDTGIQQFPTPDTFNNSTMPGVRDQVVRQQSSTEYIPMEPLMTDQEYLTFDDHDPSFADFLNNILMPSTNPPDLSRDNQRSTVWSHRDVLDFGFHQDIDLDGLDLSTGPLVTIDESPLRPSYPTTPHIVAADQQHSHARSHRTSRQVTPVGHYKMRLTAQAFRESLWSFMPAQSDHASADQVNFTIPLSDLVSHTKCATDQPLCPALGHNARDRMLGTTLATCDSALSLRIMSVFPSGELLTNMIHWGLLHVSRMSSTWLHIPSFDPNEESAELLITLVAAGAFISKFAQVRKLGSAFQECARSAVAKLFEFDNRNTRLLRPIQAFVLQLDLGLWSGDRRKMEIAESFSQPLVTMMRRAGRFQTSTQDSPRPLSQDSSSTLQEKWHRWIESESWKRLAYHSYVRDADISFCLQIPTMIPYSEVAIPLPSSRELWTAENVTKWRDLSLVQCDAPSREALSLRACIHNLELLPDLGGLVDQHVLIDSVLSGLHGFTWNYRQIDILVKHSVESTQSTSCLIKNSLYQEIMQMLEKFEFITHDLGGVRPQASMMHQRLLMSLHVSLEDVQLLAGKAGESGAREAYILLIRWSKTRECRQALKHAGQILRFAKICPIGTLRDSLAVVVYHAILVLWAFSIMSLSHSQTNHLGVRHSSNQGIVCLDGEDSVPVDKWVALGMGRPSIFRSAGGLAVDITDIETVIDATTILLVEKSDSGKEFLPPLVGNLNKLMRSLGNTASTMQKAREASSQDEV